MIATKNLKTCLESPWIGLKDGLKFDFKNLAIFGQIWSNFRVIFLLDAFHGGKKFKAKSASGRSELSKYTPKSFPIWSLSRFRSDFRSGVEGKILPKIGQKMAKNRVKLTRCVFASFFPGRLYDVKENLRKFFRENATRQYDRFSWPIFGQILPSPPIENCFEIGLNFKWGNFWGYI